MKPAARAMACMVAAWKPASAKTRPAASTMSWRVRSIARARWPAGWGRGGMTPSSAAGRPDVKAAECAFGTCARSAPNQLI